MSEHSLWGRWPDGLTPTAKLLAVRLAGLQQVHATLAWFEADLGVHHKTIRAAMWQLEDLGWLDRQAVHGVTLYRWIGPARP